MTLVEATKYLEQWEKSPPTHVLVKALLDGLSGKATSDSVAKPDSYDPLPDLAVVSSRAQGGLPIRQGRDPLDSKVVLDLEVMSRRNAERAAMMRSR